MALGPFSLPPSLPFSASSSSSSSTLMAISNITSRVGARRASAKCHFYIDLCPNRLAIAYRKERRERESVFAG